MKMYEMYHVKILILIFTIFFNFKNVENRRSLKFTNLLCTPLDVEFSTIRYCYMKALPRDRTQISIYVNMLQLPVNNISLRMQLKRRGNALRPVLHDFKFDICEILKDNYKGDLALYVLKLFGMRKYSNLNHTCPFDHDIILDKFEMDDKTLSIFPLSLGDYGLVLTWMAYKKPRIKQEFYFQLYEK